MNYYPRNRPLRFGKTARRHPSKMLKYITESFEPRTPWEPFKLINESLGIAHTILEKMKWVDIVRHVLQDETNPSALSQVVKGKRKSINGWRCEKLNE